MTYNADGSEYYLIAQSLKKIFEEKYAKMVKEEGAGEAGARFRGVELCAADIHTPLPVRLSEESLDLARPPTLVDKKMFSQNIYNVSAEDLGKIVQILDQRCEVRWWGGQWAHFASLVRRACLHQRVRAFPLPRHAHISFFSTVVHQEDRP